eukprot:Awhi_evm1s13900
MVDIINIDTNEIELNLVVDILKLGQVLFPSKHKKGFTGYRYKNRIFTFSVGKTYVNAMFRGHYIIRASVKSLNGNLQDDEELKAVLDATSAKWKHEYLFYLEDTIDQLSVEKFKFANYTHILWDQFQSDNIRSTSKNFDLENLRNKSMGNSTLDERILLFKNFASITSGVTGSLISYLFDCKLNMTFSSNQAFSV